MGAAVPIHAVLRYESVQLLATVVACDPQRQHYLVQSEAHAWQVERAASCLMAPAVGDLVLICGPAHDQVFLIAVVRQRDSTETCLDVAGDLHIASRSGHISVEGESVGLKGRQTMTLDTPALNARADRAACAFNTMDYLGVQATIGVERVSVVGRVCEVVMDRLSHLANSMFRLTRDTEQARAGRMDLQAEYTLRMHAEHTLVTAKDLVKVDADQIHMG